MIVIFRPQAVEDVVEAAAWYEAHAPGLGEQLIDGLPTRFGVSSHFTKHDYCAVAVLVASEVSAAVTVAFFATKNVK